MRLVTSSFAISRSISPTALWWRILGHDDELVGRLADRMAADNAGRVPILSRGDGSLVGLVARRDLLRVRASVLRHEQEREALIRFGAPAERAV